MTASTFSTGAAASGTAVGGSRHPVAASLRLSPFSLPRPTDDAVRDATILVVDDEAAVVKLVSKHLTDAGFKNVRPLSQPTKVLATIETMLPDLVLLDVRMRPANGLEILKAMRRNERTQNIPVIILTSDMSEAIEIAALSLGASDFLTKPVRAGQLCARVRNTLSVKICRDLATNYSIQLESDVLRDGLMGIANRRAFEYEIKRRISEWNRDRIPLGLLMIDLDHFKKINDIYGHRVGDNALRGVAKVLATATREMDLIARYGGEEFAVILPKTTIRESMEVAERVRTSMEAFEFTVEEQKVRMTVSVGLANAMRGDDANLFVRRADVALYSAKQQGRNRSSFHDGANCVLLTESEDASLKQDLGNMQFSGVVDAIEDATIAIVDDEPLTISVVKKYLKDAGFTHFVEVTEAHRAVDTIRMEMPDLVLLDVRMPKVNGLEILQELRNGPEASDTPVLIFTSESDKATKVKALNLGASDFLQKPVDASELLARIRNTLLAKSHMDNLASHSSRLEHEVCLRTTELSMSRREAIQCLARAAELRDDQTGQHVLRVGRYAAIIAEELGFSEERVEWIEHAAQLHDVGKIGVPDSILHNPGQLSNDEWEVMKAHCLGGTRILLDDVDKGQQSPEQHVEFGVDVFEGCNSPIMKMASLVAQTHHEKWNGTGYPPGSPGRTFPLKDALLPWPMCSTH